MKDIKAQKAGMLLQKLVSEGEHENQDFKFTVNDPRKIARTVSAFANHSGGHLLIGVDDNGTVKGVRSEEDIYVVEAAAQMYCEPPCPIEFTGYKAPGGALVIRAEISPSHSRPVYVREEDGKYKAYYRVSDENILAHPLMLRAWKYVDDPGSSLLFDVDSRHTSVLDVLKKQSLSPEDLARRIELSRQSLRQIIVELYGMKLIDFVFRDRKFVLEIKSENVKDN